MAERHGLEPDLGWANYSQLETSCRWTASALSLAFRNAVINAIAIPGLARASFGREIIDALPLPEYRWPALHRTEA